MEDTIWWTILVQGIGFVGVISTLVAYQCKQYKWIIGLRTLNELAFTVQYLFLGAYTGVAVGVLGCVRNGIFLHLNRRGKSTRLWRGVFCLVFVVASLLTWSGFKSILTAVAKVASTISYGSPNPRLIRLVTLCSSTCWLIYNSYVASAAGVLGELVTLTSVVVGIVRFDLMCCRGKSST